MLSIYIHSYSSTVGAGPSVLAILSHSTQFTVKYAMVSLVLYGIPYDIVLVWYGMDRYPVGLHTQSYPCPGPTSSPMPVGWLDVSAW